MKIIIWILKKKILIKYLKIYLNYIILILLRFFSFLGQTLEKILTKELKNLYIENYKILLNKLN